MLVDHGSGPGTTGAAFVDHGRGCRRGGGFSVGIIMITNIGSSSSVIIIIRITRQSRSGMVIMNKVSSPDQLVGPEF